MDPVFEDVSELEDAILSDLDQIKLNIPRRCSFYKQLKLKPVISDNLYKKYKEDDFFDLAYSYPRVDDEYFDLSKLEHAVFTRFVELLASLTLYHFSKTSKGIYYHCLNIRGLEYKSMSIYSPSSLCRIREFDVKGPYFEGFEGMRCGYVERDKFQKFKICQSNLNVAVNYLIQNPGSLPFVRNYKSLSLEINPRHSEEEINHIFRAVCHPGILFANIIYENMELEMFDPYQELPLEHFSKVLDLCKNVKVLHISVRCRVMPGIVPLMFKGNPRFSLIKDMIELWALQTTQLELFLFDYKKHQFQLRNNVLKRVVLSKNKWYFTDDCNIDDNRYQTHLQQRCYTVYPWDHLGRSHYDDIVSRKRVESVFRTKLQIID